MEQNLRDYARVAWSRLSPEPSSLQVVNGYFALEFLFTAGLAPIHLIAGLVTDSHDSGLTSEASAATATHPPAQNCHGGFRK